MRKLFTLLAAFVLLCGQLAAQSSRTVKGTVTDDKGIPLAGVTVSAVGTNKKAITDVSGNFAIEITNKVKALQFTYVGFALQEVSVSDASVVNISINLKAEDASLSEVVVVGYGTQKRKDVTGNLATVKGSSVAERPIQSFEQGIAGKAAGVQITVPNGVLNTPPVFRIRGTNSISLSSYPLVVIDGVPSFTGDYSSTNAAGNALASLNPNDIESIDIAKDAAATAIYGSRAANGVVFITTKKGRSGKTKVTYDGWVGWTKAYNMPDVMDAFQYTDYKNMAAANNPSVNSTNPAGSGYTKFALTTGPDGQPINTNWADVIYRQGFSHSHNLNVSGGNEGTTYYFSVGYTDQEGIVRKNDFKRSNALFNIDSRLSKMFTAGGKLSFSNEKNLAATSSGSLSGEAFGTAGLGRLAVVNAPNVSPFKNDGSYNISTTYIGSMSNSLAQVGFFNPAVLLDLNRSNSELQHLQSNMYLQAKPFSWMTLKTLYGIDYIFVDNDLFWNPIHGDGQTYGGYATSNYGKYKRWVWSNTAQFDKTFGNHDLSLLIGNEQQRSTSIGSGLNRQNLSDPAYNVIQAGFTNNNAAGLVMGENYLLSGFARLNYNYKNKYFIQGNIRQDEASQLGIKKGTFWGVSGKWDIGKEGFWSSTGIDRVINSFAVRASYGKVGNIAGIGDFDIYSTYGSGLYGGNPTQTFSNAGNDQLTWETSKKMDVGITFSALKNRISGEAAWYKNDITDLILGVPQAPSAGVPSTIAANVGTMYNKGIELTLSAAVLDKKDFSWNTSFNLTTVKNEVTSLAPGLTEILTATSSLETVSRTAVGYSLGYLYVVRTGGVDPASGRRIFINSQGKQVYYQYYAPSGQFNWSLADGTKYISPTGGTSINQASDAVMYANVLPKQYGGWDNTFRYKGVELNVLLTYQAGFYVYYGTNAGLHDQRFWNNSVEMLSAWKKAGDATNWPRPVYGDNVSNGSSMPLDINVFKGDFVKLKNLALSYNLPKIVTDKLRVSSVKAYVSGQNLHIWTKYPGPDPEVSSNGNGTRNQGVDRNTIGNAKTITVGLRVAF